MSKLKDNKNAKKVIDKNSKYSCDNEIDYNKSKHTKGVQRSRYIQLDGDLGSDDSDDNYETKAAGFSAKTYQDILGYMNAEEIEKNVE